MHIDPLFIDITYIHSSTNEKTNDLVTFNKDNLNYEIFKNEIIKQKNIPTNESGHYSIDNLTLQLVVVYVDTFELTRDNFDDINGNYLKNFNYQFRQRLDLYCNVGWKPVKPKISTYELLDNQIPVQLKVYLNINKNIHQKYIAKIVTERKYEELDDVFLADQSGIDTSVLVNVDQFIHENKIYVQIGCGNEMDNKPEFSDEIEVNLQLNANMEEKNNDRLQSQSIVGRDSDPTHLVLIAPPCRDNKRYYYNKLFNPKEGGYVPFKTLNDKHGVFYCQHKGYQWFKLFELHTNKNQRKNNPKAIERTKSHIPPKTTSSGQRSTDWEAPKRSRGGDVCMVIDLIPAPKSYGWFSSSDDSQQLKVKYTSVLTCVLVEVLSQIGIDNSGYEHKSYVNKHKMDLADGLETMIIVIDFLIYKRKVAKHITLSPFFVDKQGPNKLTTNIRHLLAKMSYKNSNDTKHAVFVLFVSLFLESINSRAQLTTSSYRSVLNGLLEYYKQDLNLIFEEIGSILRRSDVICRLLQMLREKFERGCYVAENFTRFGILVVWYNIIHGIWMKEWAHIIPNAYSNSIALDTQKVNTTTVAFDAHINVCFHKFQMKDKFLDLISMEAKLWSSQNDHGALSRALPIDRIILRHIKDRWNALASTKFKALTRIVARFETMEQIFGFLQELGESDYAVIEGTDLSQWECLMKAVTIMSKKLVSHEKGDIVEKTLDIVRKGYIDTLRLLPSTNVNAQQMFSFFAKNEDFVNDDVCLEMLERVNCW